MVEDMPLSMREKRMKDQETELQERNRVYHIELTEANSQYHRIIEGAQSEVSNMSRFLEEIWQDYEGTNTRVAELDRYRNFMQEVATHLAQKLYSLQSEYDEHSIMARQEIASCMQRIKDIEVNVYQYTQDAQFQMILENSEYHKARSSRDSLMNAEFRLQSECLRERAESSAIIYAQKEEVDELSRELQSVMKRVEHERAVFHSNMETKHRSIRREEHIANEFKAEVGRIGSSENASALLVVGSSAGTMQVDDQSNKRWNAS